MSAHIKPHITTLHNIFLSSTNDAEVRRYRVAAKEVIAEEEFQRKWLAVEMDQFLPSPTSSLKECERLVISCSVYVGIMGPFYGSVNEEKGISYTEFEYSVAKEHNREIGIFFLPNSLLNASDPEYVIRQSKWIERQSAFKQQLNIPHTTRSVSDLDDFKSHFRRYLRSLDEKISYPQEEIFTSGLNSSNKVASSSAILEELSFDRRPVTLSKSIQNLDNRQFAELLKSTMSRVALDARGSLDVDQEGHLRVLGVIHEDGRPTIGAFMCLAPYTELVNGIGGCALHMTVYDGTTKGASRTIFKEEIEDNLLNLQRRGMKFFRIDAGLKRLGSIGSEDRDELEIPEIVLREALGNALVHRDYETSGTQEQPTRIEVFSDRVEITSFGGLVGGISEHTLNQNPENVQSRRRNPIIAKIFMYMQLVELGGSGVSRMHQAMKERLLPKPTFYSTSDANIVPAVKIILYRPIRAINSARIFLSYQRNDVDTALKVHNALEQAGYIISSRLITDSIRYDQESRQTLAIDIAESNDVILMISNESISSSALIETWRYYRREGLRVFPVKLTSISTLKLPIWTLSSKWYDISEENPSADEEWRSLTKELNSSHVRQPLPFNLPDLPNRHSPRFEDSVDLRDALQHAIKQEGSNFVVVSGVAGSGKTVLAASVGRENSTYDMFSDGIIWLNLSDSDSFRSAIDKLTHLLRGGNSKTRFRAGLHETLLEQLIGDKNILLILDEVTDIQIIRPFVGGAKNCIRLVLTQNFELASTLNAPEIRLTNFNLEVARGVLLAGLKVTNSKDEQNLISSLIARFIETENISQLSVLNSILRERVLSGMPLSEAILQLMNSLKQ